MTAINNIQASAPQGTNNPKQSKALSAGQGGLAEFIAMLLGQVQGLPDGQNTLAAAGDLKAFSEKIAAEANLNPEDLKKIVASLEEFLSGDTTALAVPLQSALTRDLTATLAVDAQDADLNAMKDIATVLNNIEPGSTGEENAALAKFQADILSLLEQQGLSKEDIAKRLAALNGKPAAILEKVSPESLNLLTRTDEEAKAALQKARETLVRGTDVRDIPAAKPEQPAPATQAQPAAKPAVSSVALVNALAQGNGESFTSGDGSQSFSQNHGQTLADSMGYLKTSSDVRPQVFASYMAAGRSMPTQALNMVAVQIQRNAAARIDTFTLQLEPADLGRLDIRMKFGRDGDIKVHMSADRPETLSMLQKDTQQLERILQQAGLQADENTLSFDLRQHGESNLEGYRDGKEADVSETRAGADLPPEQSLPANVAAATGYVRLGGVNIMV